MSEAATYHPSPDSAPQPSGDARFDDRIDTDPRIDNLEVLRLLGRSLKLLGAFKGLFAAKLALSTLALAPALYVAWLPKIVIDQVLLGRPFDETEVPFPPHLAPLVNILRDMGPMEIMATVILVFIVLQLFFGRDDMGMFNLAQGEDSATQSENAMNTGGSSAEGVVGVSDAFVQIRLSQRLSNRLRTRLFRRMARLPMTTLDDHRIGDAVYRVMYDAPMVPAMCYQAALEPVFLILRALIALYLMHYSYGGVAPELVWISASLIPIGLLITLPLSNLTRRVQQRSRAAGTATTNAIEESLSNITAVQSLGGMSREKTRIERQSKESYRRFRHTVLVQILIGMVTTAGLACVAFFAVVFITDHIIDGVLTPGDFGVLYALVIGSPGMGRASLGRIGLSIGTLWIGLQGAAAAVRRVFFFIDLPSEDAGAALPPVAALKEAVRIEDVDFSYPDGRQAVKNINLELKPSELVAIVGPTGAGKTSLAYLVPGFLRPTRGRVLFDGRDIADVNVDSLRDQVSYVYQEHLLLSESIRDNLLLVNAEATEAEMREALATAGALDFVDALPDGMDTILGRSGDTLSVGQKQRLSIARGLLRRTSILILDEPTAALDPTTENALVRALRQTSRRRLVVVIAHRLSTIRRADRIVFLEDGEIKDIGSHDALMAKAGGRYRRFVELQGG